jgi:hypothetical protein
MNMAKKLSLLLAATAVLAFAVPAFAHAETGLTMPEGTLITPGTIITGTNILDPATGTKQVITTSARLSSITCESVMVAAKLTVNSSTEVKAGEAGAFEQTASICFRGGRAEVKVFGIQLNELQTKGGGTGKVSLSYKVEITPGGTVCTFTGTNDVFTYTPGSDTITIENGALSVTPAACGSAALDGSFTLSTKGTTEPVLLM